MFKCWIDSHSAEENGKRKRNGVSFVSAVFNIEFHFLNV